MGWIGVLDGSHYEVGFASAARHLAERLCTRRKMFERVSTTLIQDYGSVWRADLMLVLW